MDTYHYDPYKRVIVIADTRKDWQMQQVARFKRISETHLDDYPNARMVRVGTTAWADIYCTDGAIEDRAVVGVWR